MNDDKSNSNKAPIVIRQLARGDSRDLISAGFPFSHRTLRPFLYEKVFQALKFYPFEIRLVAYHVNKKRAIGYLSLVAHSQLIYSIRYVFSDPKFRQKGVATGLITYSLTLAKNRGAKKVFLTANQFSSAARLYNKLGFKILSEYPKIDGAGHTSNFQYTSQDSLIALRLCSQKNKKELFKIYNNSMDQNIIDFFGIDINNFINGYSQDFQRFFVKSAFINDSKESLALVFNLPSTHTAIAELYSKSSTHLHSMIKTLMNTLHDRGITYIRISIFNAKDQECFNLLKKNGFYPYQGVFMGISL